MSRSHSSDPLGKEAPAAQNAVQGEVTRLLPAARAGRREAFDRVLQLVYHDLRALAGRQLGREGAPRTLQPTALVHEAYIKLAAGGDLPAKDRAHLLAIAARAMRQILVDEARRRKAAKRGGGESAATLMDGHGAVDLDLDEMLALDAALDELDPRERRIVELRFFAGLEEEEIAAALDVSTRTVRRDWVKARARLYRRLYPMAPVGGPPP